MIPAQTCTRRERKRLRKQGITIDTSLPITKITPLTDNQERAFRSYKQGKNMFLYGTAGTGKSFIASYLAMKDIQNLNNDLEKLIIIRSVVPSRQIGFLPGSSTDKAKEYEAPYYEIFSKLYEREDAYLALKQKKQLHFTTTSFLRGITFDNCILLLDECQNMTYQELHTVLTRVGNNCKIILCGDLRQSDLDERNGKHDLKKIMNIVKHMNRFDFIEMTADDIVRSGFVKNFIMTSEKLGYAGI
jgi:phosphate starvation-inducible protein PhoH